jgi:phage terminase Nu1 subunit (DNA packaging protein)
MKLQGDHNLWTVTQTQFGQIIGVSQQRVNQLIDEKIVLKDESSKNSAVLLIDSLREYYCSKQAAKDGGESVNFWKERALNEKAKRELNELKLAKARGEVYEAATVEAVMQEQLTDFKNKLLSLPNKLSPQLEGKTAGQINRLLNEELEDALKELAENYESADLNEEIQVIESDDAGGTAPDA